MARSYNFSTLTNVELVSWALYSLREYRERTGVTTFLLAEAVLKDERTDLREQMRQAVDMARSAASYRTELASLGPDDDTPENDARVQQAEREAV